jgi:hypothetical protein
MHRTSFTGESWLINLIRFVWDKWYTLWKQRNQELHGRNVATRMAAESKEVRRQLNDIYMRRQQLEPRIQDLLFEEVEQHYEVSTAVTKNWLRINSGLFRDSMRRVKTKAIQGVRLIRTYLHLYGNLRYRATVWTVAAILSEVVPIREGRVFLITDAAATR